MMHTDKLEAAKKLAKAHFRIERQLRSIHIIDPMHDQDPEEPIKLLEVVDGTIERGIEPVSFTPDPARGIPYATIIVEVSPREFEAIQNGKLPLGNTDWSVGEELLA